MLLNFTAKNYKSFADKMNFSMTAAPRQNDLKYSLFTKKVGGKDYNIQCSSVVYGANASGKSNIIGAMDTFKSIVLRGNIKNTETASPNVAASKLELIPNINSSVSKPVEFVIEFIENSLLYKYVLAVDLGQFLESGNHRKILSEELYLNNKFAFRRSDRIELGEYRYLKNYLLLKQDDLDKMKTLALNGLSDNELFLTNGFKVIFSPVLVKNITDWLEKKFIVVYRADAIESVGDIPKIKPKGVVIEQRLNEAAKIFGSIKNTIGYMSDNDTDEGTPTLCSILDTEDANRKKIIPSEFFESYGTVRFITLFPLVLSAFSTGATLVVDEFDASIHPSALMNMINLFHNNSINKNHAQLIFNTHNPIFLNSNLFRRDEIKFVQRDNETGNSELYSLSDFGTSGKNGVRNSTDYMKYYLDYNYGAIEDVDLAPIFENMINNDNSENKGGE